MTTRIDEKTRLNANDLRKAFDTSELDFETTEELEPLDEIVGQERAVSSIRLGLEMDSFGYNIYVAGLPGTGKKSLVQSLVGAIAQERATPGDLCFVHNFEQPDHPRAVEVPAGVGCRFKKDMEELIATLKDEIPKAFKSEDFETRRNQIIQKFQEKRNELVAGVQEKARETNLAVKSGESQILTVPVEEGKELTPEEFQRLPEERQEEIRKNQLQISETVQETYRQIRKAQQETHERLRELDRTVGLIATGHYLDAIRQDYAEFEQITSYLKDVQKDIIENISQFVRDDGETQDPLRQMMAGRMGAQEDPFRRYEVNVIVDHSRTEGAPVVSESDPTYRNLIGILEREARMGTLVTDFTMIRAGSILEANGGFLILDMIDLLITPLAWESLKRVLQDGTVRIQDPMESYGFIGTHGLRPEPVKIRLKVIISGSRTLYNLLYAVDEDFQKLFKVKADFGTAMKKQGGHGLQYAQFIKKISQEEGLRHFHKDAVAGLMEHFSRLVSDQNRLSLQFAEVADVIRESSYWASKDGNGLVNRSHVERAIAEKRFRSNLVEERLQDMIDEDVLLIQTEGEAVGQINALSVYSVGDYSFARPTRVTAQVSPGTQGVVNIEREAKLSGSIHDKGVLILSGFLHGKYGSRKPLSLYASIGFEQSYAGVDGDSASSTELYAILSSLTQIPVKQSLAVTGSINQKGMIQPIGGVNEKIEGFFETCSARGLTGVQGVIIPKQNVQHLMLREEVLVAVREGRFHVYAIENVDEGIELLMGRPAGNLQEDGSYPEGTVHFLAQQRIEEMSKVVEIRQPIGEMQKGEES